MQPSGRKRLNYLLIINKLSVSLLRLPGLTFPLGNGSKVNFGENLPYSLTSVAREANVCAVAE